MKKKRAMKKKKKKKRYSSDNEAHLYFARSMRCSMVRRTAPLPTWSILSRNTGPSIYTVQERESGAIYQHM